MARLSLLKARGFPMTAKLEGNGSTTLREFWKSCFTTLLIFATIGLTVYYIIISDYLSVGKLWFISALLYSLDQFVLKRIIWPNQSEKRKKKFMSKLQ